MPVALERAAACGMPPLQPADVIVVGDTPHDVACAQAVGAVPVGVATGNYTADELRACGAEVVFETLRGCGRDSRACCSPVWSRLPPEPRRASRPRCFGATALACQRLAGLAGRSSPKGAEGWRKRLGVEPSPPTTRAGGDRF